MAADGATAYQQSVGTTTGEATRPWNDEVMVGLPHRSITSRSPRHRETQTIIVSFDAFSESLSTTSRWSTSPSRTTVSHVPHTPSWQEPSTGMPSSSTAWKIALAGRDHERLARSGEHDLERGVAGTRRAPCARKRSRCSAPSGHVLQAASTASRRASGPQRRRGCRAAECRADRSMRWLSVTVDLVAGQQHHLVAVLLECGQERHGRAGPAAVDQLPVGPDGLRLLDHRQHRRDADAARR